MVNQAGYKVVLPQLSNSDLTNDYTGAVGTYSFWYKMADVHLLDGAPLEDHVPGTGRFPGDVQKSQQFVGTYEYKPMELAKYVHKHDVSYLISDPKLFQGLDASAVFAGSYGHDGTREFNYSRFRQIGGLGLTDPLTDPGKAEAAYGETYVNMGPTKPYIFQGVGQDILEDSGEGLAAKQAAEDVYGFEEVRIHQGVPSSTALSV